MTLEVNWWKKIPTRSRCVWSPWYREYMGLGYTLGYSAVAGSFAVVSPCGPLPRLLQCNRVPLRGLHASSLWHLYRSASYA